MPIGHSLGRDQTLSLYIAVIMPQPLMHIPLGLNMFQPSSAGCRQVLCFPLHSRGLVGKSMAPLAAQQHVIVTVQVRAHTQQCSQVALPNKQGVTNAC